MTRPALAAAILTGGLSRRMGRDKARVLIDGEPMLARVIAAARDGGLAPFIVDRADRGDLELRRSFQLGVYHDLIDGMGPLSGLFTAFERTDHDRIFLLATDLPFLSGAMLRFIAEMDGWDDKEALIPLVDGKEQGLTAIYRRGAVERFRAEIEARAIQFDRFRASLDRKFIEEDQLRAIDPELRSFINVNRMDDAR